MEVKSGMSIQPSERDRTRFDMGPPSDHDPGPGLTFGSALRRHWRVMAAGIGGLALPAIPDCLASEALVGEANRASDASPGQLLKQYQAAESQREQAQSRLSELSQGLGTGSLAAARTDLVAARAQADSLRKRYVTSEQGGSVRL